MYIGKAASIPIVYGPMDSFPYKVELKHENWRNVDNLLKSGAKFSLMSDHPVILQRNMFYTKTPATIWSIQSRCNI
jgi:imidazolonepropionase-like amidohydrolase